MYIITFSSQGRVYATAMIKTILVYVIRSIRLETDGEMNDIPLEVAISVKAANGYQVRVQPRTRGKTKPMNGVAQNGSVGRENGSTQTQNGSVGSQNGSIRTQNGSVIKNNIK